MTNSYRHKVPDGTKRISIYFTLLLACLIQIPAMSQRLNRFIVVSDIHHYSPSPDFTNSRLYEFALAAIHEQVDFIFLPGDLGIRGFASPSEEDSVLKDWRFVLDTLQAHNIRLFACRGNTDGGGREAWDSLFSGQYAFPQNGPEQEKNLSYAITYDNLLFIVMDQFTAYYKINQHWLDSILADNKQEYIFAAGHTPAFKLYNSNCLATYPASRDSLWESLTRAGARAYFSGHNHFYDHAALDDGDGNPDNDIHQLIVGTGGGSFFSASEYNGNNGRWTPEGIFHEAANGYVLAEVNDSGIRLTWKHRIDPHVFVPGGDSCSFSSKRTESSGELFTERHLKLYPNPFSSRTMIGYCIPFNDKVELNVYDFSGRKIITLVNESRPAGCYKVEWVAADMNPGVYLCELKTLHSREIVKMLLLGSHSVQ